MNKIEQYTTIPTVKGIPLLGAIPKLLGNDPMEYLKNIMLKHGDMVKLYLGTTPIYLASSPELLQQVFRDKYSNYRKPAFVYDTVRQALGDGLVTSSGDKWIKQRRMIQPHLHRKQLAQLFTDMVDAINEAIQRTKDNIGAEGSKEINLAHFFSDMTIKIIMNTMFGKGILSSEEIRVAGECGKRIVEYFTQAMIIDRIPQWIPVPRREQFKADLTTFHSTVKKMIDHCRQFPEASSGLIRMLMDTMDEDSNEQMTEQQLMDEVVTIFVAGYETTATALTWWGVVIERYPSIVAKLQEEVRSVLGTNTPTFESVRELVYARKVFLELLRKYSVVPLLFRSANWYDILGGYSIPQDATVFAFIHGVHHNPRVWNNPDSFDPERFTPEEIAKHHQFAFLPFSAGQRKCAGDDFALLEGQLIIAMMIQNFDIEIVANQRYTTRFGGTMRPKNGVKAILKKRWMAEEFIKMALSE